MVPSAGNVLCASSNAGVGEAWLLHRSWACREVPRNHVGERGQPTPAPARLGALRGICEAGTTGP